MSQRTLYMKVTRTARLNIFQYLQPLVEYVLHADELLLPGDHVSLEGLHVRRAAHRLRLEDVVVQLLLDVVQTREDAYSCVPV